MTCGSLLSGLGRAVSGKAGYDCELSGHGKAKCSTREVLVESWLVTYWSSLVLSCAE